MQVNWAITCMGANQHFVVTYGSRRRHPRTCGKRSQNMVVQRPVATVDKPFDSQKRLGTGNQRLVTTQRAYLFLHG